MCRFELVGLAGGYVPGIYWLAVVLISVVGTLIIDNLVNKLRGLSRDDHHSSLWWLGQACGVDGVVVFPADSGLGGVVWMPARGCWRVVAG
jgi:hypothetical protein